MHVWMPMRLNIFPLVFNNRHLLIPLHARGRWDARCTTLKIKVIHPFVHSTKYFWSTHCALGTEDTHVSGQGEWGGGERNKEREVRPEHQHLRYREWEFLLATQLEDKTRRLWSHRPERILEEKGERAGRKKGGSASLEHCPAVRTVLVSITQVLTHTGPWSSRALFGDVIFPWDSILCTPSSPCWLAE